MKKATKQNFILIEWATNVLDWLGSVNGMNANVNVNTTVNECNKSMNWMSDQLSALWSKCKCECDWNEWMQ